MRQSADMARADRMGRVEFRSSALIDDTTSLGDDVIRHAPATGVL
jgi:hypothetical protein